MAVDLPTPTTVNATQHDQMFVDDLLTSSSWSKENGTGVSKDQKTSHSGTQRSAPLMERINNVDGKHAAPTDIANAARHEARAKALSQTSHRINQRQSQNEQNRAPSDHSGNASRETSWGSNEGWPQSALRLPNQSASSTTLPSAQGSRPIYGNGGGNTAPSNPYQMNSGFRYPPGAGPSNAAYQQSYNSQRPAVQPASRPLFSTGGFQAVNRGIGTSASILNPPSTSAPKDVDSDDDFNPDAALGGNRYDPFDYQDSAKASENIKALLEGAFEEDDEDKPKRRLRRRKDQDEGEDKDDELDDAVEQITAQMKGVKVEDMQKAVKKPKDDEGNEDEEEDDGTVEGLSVKLLPHQIDGVSWMMDKEIGSKKKNGVIPKGGILADDMGLGKTIQALSLILSHTRPSDAALAKQKGKKRVPLAASKTTLVVAPLALIKQWESEMKDKVLEDRKFKVLVHHGPSRAKDAEVLKKNDVVITTYQTLTSEHESSSTDEDGTKTGCFGVHWYRIILDEAHSIKNRNAKMTKAACDLKSVYRWCLTGTPMQNNLDELQSLIRFLRVKPYQNLQCWKDQISMPMQKGRGGIAVKRLQYFLKALMLRRTKDVLRKQGALNFGKKESEKTSTTSGSAADQAARSKSTGFKIVARNVETIDNELDAREKYLYDRLADRTEKNLAAMMGGKKDYIGALVLLLRLRQSCNHYDLTRANAKNEKDSLGNGGDAKAIASTSDEDVDDVADMFGTLTVASRKCDICQTTLSHEESKQEKRHCTECEADLSFQSRTAAEDAQKHQGKSSKYRHRKPKGVKSISENQQRRNLHARRIVESGSDSDEDSENGEWLVPSSQRKSEPARGRLGDTDDEDAEGGGEWISESAENSLVTASTDNTSVTGDESSSQEDSEYEAEPTNGVSPSTKITTLISLLRKEAPAHKFIVFSEFTSFLDMLAPFLSAARVSFVRYDGRMQNAAREGSLDSLRNNPKTRVLLCSLRCGALGLNLTAASRVVILEPFWNPFVEEQAIDRVHRIGQTQDVTVYRFRTRGTVEERIVDLQEKKRELAKMALGGGEKGGQGAAKLNMSDIMGLFKREAEHSADVDDQRLERLRGGGVLDDKFSDKAAAPATQTGRQLGGRGTRGDPYNVDSSFASSASVKSAGSDIGKLQSGRAQKQEAWKREEQNPFGRRW